MLPPIRNLLSLSICVILASCSYAVGKHDQPFSRQIYESSVTRFPIVRRSLGDQYLSPNLDFGDDLIAEKYRASHFSLYPIFIFIGRSLQMHILRSYPDNHRTVTVARVRNPQRAEFRLNPIVPVCHATDPVDGAEKFSH